MEKHEYPDMKMNLTCMFYEFFGTFLLCFVIMGVTAMEGPFGAASVVLALYAAI
jgi:glycerol uptake facilitator-like aquaporin